MKARKKKSDIEKLRDGGLRLWHIVAIALLFILMVCAVVYSYDNRRGIGTELLYDTYDNDLILNGLYVESVNVGGLTKEQAEEKVNREYVQPFTSCELEFQYKDYTSKYTMEDAGLEFNVKKAVNEAYKAGRKGSKLDRIAYADEVADRREFIAIEFGTDEGKENSLVNTVSRELSKTGIKANKSRLKLMLDSTLERGRYEDSIISVPVE